MPTASKSTALALVGSQEGMKALTKALQGGIDAILPPGISASKIVHLACIATMKNPKLLQCTRDSMILALTASAAFALDPSGTLGHSWIVPFFNNKLKVMEAVFLPGWKGLVQLTFRSGRVESVMPDAVYEQDEFKYQKGDTPRLIHTPTRPTPDRKCWIADVKWEKGKLVSPGHLAGSLVGAYCTWTVNGVRSFKFRWAEELEKIRLNSKAPVSPAYIDWTEEMMIKGAVKSAIPLMPLSVEDMRLFTIATQNEDEKMGLKPFIDITGDPVTEGAHTIGAETTEADASEEGSDKPESDSGS